MTNKKPGNPGLKGKLLDKSIEAYILGLETINRLSIVYRVENFAYLLCNAWELLLKAKLLQDSGNKECLYYPKQKGERRNTLSLRDILKKVFVDQNNPIRRNIEFITILRDESTHFVISQVPREILGLFQASVLNYHSCLNNWFGRSLTDYIAVGMMAIAYDFSPEQFDLANPVLRRQLGRDTAEYLTRFQAELRLEYEHQSKGAEFSVDINYKLRLTKKEDPGNITLTKGDGGSITRVIEVSGDSGRTHPYLQKDVVKEINVRLHGKTIIKAYDVQCIVNLYGIRKRGEYYYQCSVRGSPIQYSPVFVDWMVERYQRDNSFFDNAREKERQRKRQRSSRVHQNIVMNAHPQSHKATLTEIKTRRT